MSFDTTIFDNQTGTTESSLRQGPGKFCRVYAFGNFDGATVQLQLRPIETGVTQWMSSADLTFTDTGYFDIYIGPNEHLRGKLTNSGSQTSVSLSVLPLHSVVSFS